MSEVIWELPSGGSAMSDTPELAVGERDHAAEAVARLVLQFQKPKMQALVRRLCAPIQKLEKTIVYLLLHRSINSAVGELLDLLGGLVGQPRRGLDDDTYRRYIRARIATNRSRGAGRQILKVARLVLGEGHARVELHNHGDAAFTVRIVGASTSWVVAQVLLELLRKSRGGGIRLTIEWWPEEDTEMFEFESFAPGEGRGAGWGDSNDPTRGGVLASASD